ncbi:MAG: DNA/RNA non-specific endonuclease [Chthoniobacterales bacterium]
MNRFFYYLLGSLLALVVTLGAISFFRGSATPDASTAPASGAKKTTPSPSPGASPMASLIATPPANSPPMADMPSLIGATPEAASPAATPVPWTPPNYGQTTTLTYPGYTIVYSPTLLSPLAVQYAMVGGAKPRHWPEPPKIRGQNPALLAKDGYDRGRMALQKSISLYFGKQAGKNTDLMTNCCPFNPACLTSLWTQFDDLEGKWAGEAGWIEVVAGPIFGNPPSQTANRLIVPVAFYRAYRRSYGDTIAFIIPQNAPSADLSKYLTSISVIEAATGMTIFPNTILLEQRTGVADKVW